MPKTIFYKQMMCGLFLFCMFMVFSCGDSSFKVVDSGFWVSSTRKTLWLDNHRVVFQSSESLSVNHSKEGYKNVVWDTSTGKVSFHGLWKKERVLCAKDNQLVYLKINRGDGDKPQYSWYRGTLEHLNPYPSPDESMAIDRDFDCVWELKKDTKDKLGGPLSLETPVTRDELY